MFATLERLATLRDVAGYSRDVFPNATDHASWTALRGNQNVVSMIPMAAERLVLERLD